jgi:hypothetical protein
MAILEELLTKLYEAVGGDDEKYEAILKSKGLDGYAAAFDEVMAGGLPETAITDSFVEEFSKGLKEILKEMEK